MTEYEIIRDDLERGFEVYLIPAYMRKALREYVNDHKSPGHFIQAVIMNDLVDTVFYSDEKNLSLLRAWVGIFHNYIPSACYGSKERYEIWIKNGETE